MVMLPKRSNTLESLIEGKTSKSGRSAKVAISQIGGVCIRKSWYAFRWFAPEQEISARQKRLFGRGHQEEAVVYKELKEAGIKVSGDQEVVMGFAGHVKGKLDGEATGLPEAPNVPHVLEIKTANAKSFAQIKKKGIQKIKPEYYGQVMLYMKYRKLTRAIIIVTCKDDDQRHYERINFKKADAAELERASREVVMSEHAPSRPGHLHSNCFECMHCCNFHSYCWGDEVEDVNCRTCKHSDIHNNGEWRCSIQEDKLLSYDDQRNACELHTREKK